MRPPVYDLLKKEPEIKRIRFDLNSLPDGIGARFADGELIFTDADTPHILDLIDYLLKESGETGTVYDLHIKGVLPAITAAQLAANIRLWDNVASLSFADNTKSGRTIFETPVYPLNIPMKIEDGRRGANGRFYF